MTEHSIRPAIIVGLGNPGARYRDTRHNVGFACVDALAERWRIALTDRRRTTALGQGYRGGAPVVLAKPRTFMNLSGESVAYLLARFGARPADLVIVYDEMALPLGRLRLRAQGSDAGHNGIKDIIRAVRTNQFPRLRIGIGAPGGGDGGSVGHVLGRFADAEQPVAAAAIVRAADAVECLLAEGIDIAMNRYNTDPAPAAQPVAASATESSAESASSTSAAATESASTSSESASTSASSAAAAGQ